MAAVGEGTRVNLLESIPCFLLYAFEDIHFSWRGKAADAAIKVSNLALDKVGRWTFEKCLLNSSFTFRESVSMHKS